MAKSKSNKSVKASVKKVPAKKEVPAPTPIVLKNDFTNRDQLDTTEAAEFLGCSVPLIYAMLRDGRLKKKESIGNRIYVYRSELQSLKDGKQVHPRNSKHKKTSTSIQSSQILLSDANQMVSFEVTAKAEDYNMMASLLRAQNTTVAEWISKVITAQAEQVKQQAVGLMSVASGS